MLEGNLYEILDRAEGCATVHLLPGSPIYAAHFPGYPITPGVTITQMALELMGRRMTGAREVKFLVPLLPDATVRFEWTPLAEDRVEVNVYQGADSLCAKMTLLV